MNKNSTSHSSGKRKVAAEKLMQDVGKAAFPVSEATQTDFEILSIAVEDAIKGIDISKRYPALYQKLAEDAVLRETFIDSLELAEADQRGELVPLPEFARPNLDFLKNLPMVIETGIHAWQIHLQRTSQQLQSILLSQPKLIYRSGADLFDGPWFELLHTKTEVENILYTVVLGCTPSENLSDKFSIFLKVSLEGVIEQFDRSLLARLRWGQNYDKQVLIVRDKQVRLPDISLSEIFDATKQRVSADLDLTLEVNP